MKQTRLPPDLQAAWEEIEAHARAYGLDFFPIVYEVLDYRSMYEAAAMTGFPTRYPHWRFGMDYDQLLKGHVYLGSTIYEMVINTNPSYAYLLEGNDMVTQKMVMAHVTGHVDFFKNNMWFAHTNRKMLDEMANHASRIQRIMDRYGYDVVEDFIDTCLSLENLIDYHAPYIRRPEAMSYRPIVEEDDPVVPEGLRVDREYMKGFINPPEFLASQRQRLEEERARQRRFPENPQKDILLFLMNYAPLERWQHTVLDIIRNEAYYFAPQGMTKVLNEGWACVTGDAKCVTSAGIVPIRQLVEEQQRTPISDGADAQPIYDWAIFRDRETVRIRTRRGFVLEGSTNHRIVDAIGHWRQLDSLSVGERVMLNGGAGLWAREYVSLDWHSSKRLTLQDIASHVNVDVETVIRYRNGVRGRHAAALQPLVASYEAQKLMSNKARRRTIIRIPQYVSDELGAFLGYLIGDGHISAIKRTIGLTTGDDEQATCFADLVNSLFGLPVQRRWDPNRWRISFSSLDIQDFLEYLGLPTGKSAHHKDIPDVILRSPKTVVAAFLRALYDCDGYAGDAGVILSTSSVAMSKTVQLVLLNFGILSSRRLQGDGCWHVHCTGLAARQFQQEIGFGLTRKQQALDAYITQHHWFKQEDWTDSIVEIERGRADVYDLSVTQTHRYVAQGFINHNSFWHSEIMTKKALRDDEVITFADLHSGVVATGGGRLNPYKLGIELLRDIEDRWNKGKFGKEWEECDDIAEKRNWDRKLGLGRQKIFEVRRLYNDVTFLDEFLTPEFCMEQKMFSFRYNRDTDLYEIASREFQEVKQKLLFRMTNFGQPFIYVEDGNYQNRGELYLRHRHEGVDLKMDYARETLRNIHKIWTRPIHLETLIDERRRLVSFDGKDFTERKVD